VIVTLTGSLSSPGGGAWLAVRVALRGDAARGKTKAGPGEEAKLQHQDSKLRCCFTY